MTSVRTLVMLVGLVAAGPLAWAQDADAVAWAAAQALVGCWEAGGPDDGADEVWLPLRGGAMVGVGRLVRGGRTLNVELLALRVEDGRLVYYAHPVGQAATAFPAVRMEDQLLVFENRAHDFPQALHYAWEAADRLTVSVFGAADDAEPAFSLAFRRGPCPSP